MNSNAVVSNNGLAGGISNHAFTVERCGNVGSITGCKSPSEETGVAGIDNYGQNVLYCYNTGVVTCDNEMWAYGISANGRSKSEIPSVMLQEKTLALLLTCLMSK